MKDLTTRIERLEQQRASGLIVAILNAGETEGDGRQRVMAEGGYVANPGLCIVKGTELDAML